MISFNNCSFIYKDKLLINNLSFNINRGDKFVLYGPSGSGKSTIINAILGFERPNNGDIIVDGRQCNNDNFAYIRSITSYLPQDISLPYTTVKELIYSPFEFKINKHNTPTNQEIFYYFKQLGLNENLLNANINEISGGEKQRILLATTILLKKTILLLDEPTSALDAKSILMTIDTLKSLSETTMLAISHDEMFTNSFDNKILIPKLQ